jgi:hypothetical protein
MGLFSGQGKDGSDKWMEKVVKVNHKYAAKDAVKAEKAAAKAAKSGKGK